MVRATFGKRVTANVRDWAMTWVNPNGFTGHLVSIALALLFAWLDTHFGIYPEIKPIEAAMVVCFCALLLPAQGFDKSEWWQKIVLTFGFTHVLSLIPMLAIVGAVVGHPLELSEHAAQPQGEGQLASFSVIGAFAMAAAILFAYLMTGIMSRIERQHICHPVFAQLPPVFALFDAHARLDFEHVLANAVMVALVKADKTSMSQIVDKDGKLGPLAEQAVAYAEGVEAAWVEDLQHAFENYPEIAKHVMEAAGGEGGNGKRRRDLIKRGT